jgi:hypothetical protein
METVSVRKEMVGSDGVMQANDTGTSLCCRAGRGTEKKKLCLCRIDRSAVYPHIFFVICFATYSFATYLPYISHIADLNLKL